MPRQTKKKTDELKAKKNTDARVTENLRKIYENPDGSLPDMKTIASEPEHRGWKILLRLVVLSVLFVTGFFAWKISLAPRLKFNDEIAVALSGPREVLPKTVSTYTVRYRNPGTSAVKNVMVYFEYPSYFMVTSSSKNFEPDTHKILIGDLEANQSGEITVTGSWAETVSVTTTLTAVLNYTPSNFSSIFEKKSVLEVIAPKIEITTITTSTVAVAPQALVLAFGNQITTVAPGELLPIIISLTNLGAEPIEKADLVLNIVAPSYQNKSLLNWQKISDPFDGAVKGEQVTTDFRRGLITWTPKEIKALENIAPGASTTVEIQLPIKTVKEMDFSKLTAKIITINAELRSADKVIFSSTPATISLE